MVEYIRSEDTLIAIIIPAAHSEKGIQFFTPPELSQQLAYMNRPKGYQIAAHTHNLMQRILHNTLETLIIRRGKVRIDFYDLDAKLLDQRILQGGDIILLANGGHGLTMLEDTEIVEVKQGPFAGDADKVRFKA